MKNCQEYQTEKEINSLFSQLLETIPQSSPKFPLYLYHLRRLALIIDEENCEVSITSTLRKIINVGAELPLS